MKTHQLFLFIAITCTASCLPIYEEDDASYQARIVNGVAIDIREAPYQISLRRQAGSGWSHTCGGVIITIKAVLTAAHCVSSYISEPSSLRVIAGTSSRLTGGKSYYVSRVVIHEEYISSTLVNDIAMLIVSTQMSFGRDVYPITFARYEIPAGTPALVSGYGTTAFNGVSSSQLLAAEVYIMSHEACAQSYLGVTSITSGMICATATDPPRDACQGDSGGPLVANDVLVGLVSWGEGCADPQYPGVYTKVSNYAAWIGKNLGSYS